MKKILFVCLLSTITHAYAQPDHSLPVNSINSNPDTTGKKAGILSRCGSSITKADRPLVVVDGVVVENNDLKAIKPTDIETIAVLKESAATALYENKVSRGIIVITTKKAPQRTFYIRSKEDEMPIAGATIKIFNEKAPADTITMIANDKGEVVTSKIDAKKNYTAIISSVGYKPQQLSLVFKKGADRPVLNLERKENVCEAVSVVAYPNRRVICRYGCGMFTTRTTQIESRKAVNLTIAGIYPNPASSSGEINWRLDPYFNGTIQVLNEAGQLMQSAKIAGTKGSVISIKLPNLSAGTYFVRLIDRESLKTRIEKLVVQ